VAPTTLSVYLRAGTAPTTFYVALSSTAPTVDTNTLSEITHLSTGNGYTSGGVAIPRNSTGWPTLTEDDTNDYAQAVMQAASWTASGGSIGPFQYVVLTGDGGTVGNREVLAWWPLSVAVTISNGSTWSANNATLRIATV